MAKLLACILFVCLAWGFLSEEQIEQMNAPGEISHYDALGSDSPSFFLDTLENEVALAVEDLDDVPSREIANAVGEDVVFRMKLYERMGFSDSEVRRLMDLDYSYQQTREDILSGYYREQEQNRVLKNLEDEHRKQQVGVVGEKKYQLLARSLAEFQSAYGDLSSQNKSIRR